MTRPVCIHGKKREQCVQCYLNDRDYKYMRDIAGIDTVTHRAQPHGDFCNCASCHRPSRVDRMR